MSELCPPGFENMVGICLVYTIFYPLTLTLALLQFFGLFGLSNRASSMVGPNVIQAIIDSSGSNWKGFPFLFALCTAASLVIWFFVDVTAGRRDAVAFAEARRAEKRAAGVKVKAADELGGQEAGRQTVWPDDKSDDKSD